MKKAWIGLLAVVLGAVAGALGINYFKNKIIGEKEEKVDKFKGYYNLLNQWLIIKNEGSKLEKYFIDNGYRSIAIYGMGELGKRLYEELRDSEIEIKYAIDKKAEGTYSEMNIVEKDEILEKVDAIIVSAIFAFEEIKEELYNKIDFPVISLEDVIYEL